MTDIAAGNAIELAPTIRPQGFGSRSPRGIENPLVEPAWLGIRVIAGATGATAAFFEDGQLMAGLDDVCAALARQAGSSASGVMVDGYLTKQATSDATDEVDSTPMPSTTTFLSQIFVGDRPNRGRERLAAIEAEDAARMFADQDTVAFVGVDLLWLDDTWLLDIPLLERRRLLASVIADDELVRCGPFVRPPIDSWIGSWRAQGFTGLTFKEANSRYHPGENSKEWASVPMPRR